MASDWWWADYVDRYFTDQLEVCREWIRNGRDFALTLVVPMEGDDGYWCAWMRISSPPAGLTYGILQVLFDEDVAPFTLPLVVGRPAEERPGAVVSTRVGNYGNHLHVIREASPGEYFDNTNILCGPKKERRADPHRDGVLARELCQRHGGAFLRREDDGLWLFLLPA